MDSELNIELDKEKQKLLHILVKQKLADMIASYKDGDDVLPEYVLVLIQHKKPKHQIASDLEAFLGTKESAQAFTNWLWNVLSSVAAGGAKLEDFIAVISPKNVPNKPKLNPSLTDTINNIPPARSLNSGNYDIVLSDDENVTISLNKPNKKYTKNNKQKNTHTKPNIHKTEPTNTAITILTKAIIIISLVVVSTLTNPNPYPYFLNKTNLPTWTMAAI